MKSSIATTVCVLAAFGGFLYFSVASSPRTHGVVISVRDLPTGTRLRRADLAIAQAQLPAEVASTQATP